MDPDDDPDPDGISDLDLAKWKIKQARSVMRKRNEVLTSLASMIATNAHGDNWRQALVEAVNFCESLSPKRKTKKTVANVKHDNLFNVNSVSFPDLDMAAAKDTAQDSPPSDNSEESVLRHLKERAPATFGQLLDSRNSVLARSLAANKSDSEESIEDEDAAMIDCEAILFQATAVDGRIQARLNSILTETTKPEEAVMGIISIMQIYHDDSNQRISSMVDMVADTAKRTKKNHVELKALKEMVLKRFRDLEKENSKKKTCQVDPGLNECL